jgi:hypothetical protein
MKIIIVLLLGFATVALVSGVSSDTLPGYNRHLRNFYELKHKRPQYRPPNPFSVDDGRPLAEAVVSFAPLRSQPVRQSYKSLLRYWPAEWPIHFHLDVPEREVTECLKQTASSPVVTVEHHLSVPHSKTTGTVYAKNHWKFFLDHYSNAKIIAIVDDDACLLTKLGKDDLLNERGQLIARGLGDEVSPHYRRFIVDVLKWTYIGDFMTDFPVFFFQDMLPDLREAMIAAVPNATEFEPALRWLIQQSHPRIRKFSEFAIILNFAYHSEKWRSRYDWQIIQPSVGILSTAGSEVLGMSTHQHGTGLCWTDPIHVPAHLLLYPSNLQVKFEPPNRFEPRHWNNEAIQKLAPTQHRLSASFREKRRRIANETRTRTDQNPEVVRQWNLCFGVTD